MWGWISGGKSPAVNLPVNVGEETGQCLAGRSVFKLYAGTLKTTNEPVSVFKFEATPSSTPEQKAAAKAEFKRLRVLRHPSVVKYIDGVDSDNIVVIVTEPVTPLLQHIQGESKLSDNVLCWGLYQTMTALKFLHEDCSLAHRNLYSSSIYVSNSGDWKLGGVAWCEDNTPLALPSRVNQYLSKYDPPEMLRGVNTSPLSTDVWLLGVLVWEVFNGNLSSPQSLRDTSRVPSLLLPSYRELVSSNYKSRPSVETVFEKLNQMSGYFDNSFVAANIFLNELTIKEPGEKQRFFAQLTPKLDDFPEEFCKYKILPALITTFQYGDVGIDVLPPLFKLGKLLTEDEYKSSIIPCVIKLFSSPDRAMRIQLLSQLDNFIQYLDNRTVDSEIFPAVSTGFTDTVPGMREHTVKAMLQIAGRLTETTIDNQLLKFLAKAQTDPEPPIRTNTTICISKIACHFSDATRRKVLIPAFLRALKDPFIHARHAGLLSLGCTAQYYGEVEVANRILPAVCPMLMDHDKAVREQAFKTVKLFLDKIERYNKGNPDKAPQSSANKPSNEQTSEQSQEASKGWTSWAVSSVSNIATKYTGQTGNVSKIGEIQKPVVPKPEPPPVAAVSKPALNPAPASSKPPAVSKESDDGGAGWDDGWDDISTPSLHKTKSTMKLGGTKAKSSVLDDDDTFIANIIKEEQGHLKKQTKSKPLTTSLRPKSPELSTSPFAPSPWDTPQQSQPLNNKVKLTPFDEPQKTPQSKDLLSSYFSSNASDFFGEMGVADASEPKETAPVKSEWDDFNLKVAEPEPDDHWDDWGSEKPVKQPSRTNQKSSFKPVKKTASPAFDDWNDSGWDADTKPATKSAKQPATKSATKPAKQPATKPAKQPAKQPAASSFKPVQKPARASPSFTSWDDDGWNEPVSAKTGFEPAKTGFEPAKTGFEPAKTSGFQPPATKTSGASDDWNSGWSDEPLSREDKRKEQRERRGSRTNRGGRLGAAKKE